jgi:hypothetical protein
MAGLCQVPLSQQERPAADAQLLHHQFYNAEQTVYYYYNYTASCDFWTAS